MTSTTHTPFRVVIVGGGVAGLEATLALRELAGERVSTTLLSGTPEFVYRPMRVVEPFAYAEAHHYPLDEIARDLGVELVPDAFKWLDGDRRQVHTEAGQTLEYDALLLAPGAILRPRFRHALTLDDTRLDEQLHGLIQDVEAGYVHSLAFLSPTPMPWPLPLYELALMTKRRAEDMNVELSVTVTTPEDAPLAVFGPEVSRAVRQLLEENGVAVFASAHAETPEFGQVTLHPGDRHLHADRCIPVTVTSTPIASSPSRSFMDQIFRAFRAPRRIGSSRLTSTAGCRRWSVSTLPATRRTSRSSTAGLPPSKPTPPPSRSPPWPGHRSIRSPSVRSSTAFWSVAISLST